MGYWRSLKKFIAFPSYEMNQFSIVLIAFFQSSIPFSIATPVQVQLKSQIPAEPIENPAEWAWGLHPDNGLDYAAKMQLVQTFNQHCSSAKITRRFSAR